MGGRKPGDPAPFRSGTAVADVITGMMSPWRALQEALHYMRVRSLRVFLARLVRLYVVGREQWYVTRTGLEQWVGVPPRDPTLEVRLARPEDLPHLAKYGRHRADTVARWLAPPYILFVATRDGVPIAFRSLSTMPHHWVAGFFDGLAADQIYALDLFVAPEFRNRGVTFDLMAVTNQWMVERGYRELLSIQRTDNEASIIVTTARNIDRLGTLTRTCRLGRVTFSFTPAASSRAQLRPRPTERDTSPAS